MVIVLKELHVRYLGENVFIRGEKAYDNMFFVCKVYHNCVLKEYGLNFTFRTPNYTFKFSFQSKKNLQNHVLVFNTFNFAVNGVFQHFTNNPIPSVYIEGFRKCSTKIQSLLLTKISTLENEKLSTYCATTYRRIGIHQIWTLNKSKGEIKMLSQNQL